MIEANKSILPLLFPGIIRVLHKKTDKNVFLECDCIFDTAQDFVAKLKLGVCSNSAFFQDFRKYGSELDLLDILVVKIGPQYQDKNFRKQELEKCKLNWPKENLY